MNEIRDLYEKHCFLGYRRITEILNRRMETKVNRKKVLRLMRKMGLMAVYPKRKLSNRNDDDPVYPYLLKEKPPLKPNDCWAVDITYIRICGGYAYLTALIDWVSRQIMGWSLSPFLDASSCLEALNQGLKKEFPKMVNSDQRSQFTRALLHNSLKVFLALPLLWVSLSLYNYLAYPVRSYSSELGALS
ncbi:IS3 family transposase [Candidatus Neptunichlamydia sp. REUL1]|uniref:IS3 family transposase n=1 Tax=Candidatus Neptunichlamydia sp. REUL1 TaxID=3064277 RepID=UPI00292E15F9|nr:IS3 family transposase [Candidatus Neptunochlamydia sp. REUL1]